MRLVVLALSIPVMFIAAGLAALAFPQCGVAAAFVFGYVALTPVVYFARPIRLRVKYLPHSLAVFAPVVALGFFTSQFFEYSDLVETFIATMSKCPEWRAYFFLGAVVLAPVVEEAIFRAILYNELEKRGGVLVGYVGNSMAFAIIHGLPAFIPIYLLYGLALTYVYKRAGLGASILLHSLNNFLAYLYYNNFYSLPNEVKAQGGF
ncbi:MAG: type II CAAX endopeptidase family protein [Pyrobaculum sp.]